MNTSSTGQDAIPTRRTFAGVQVPATFLLVLAVVFVALTVFAQPGVFSIDEINYLVTVVGLRHGMLDVPGTRGLTPSPELYAFDPEPQSRTTATGGIVSLAPPLYAFIAFPFSYLGWRGLILLNSLSFVAVAFILFLIAKALSGRDSVGWLVVFLWAAGGYSIEYAEAVWPHMLSVGLCSAAVLLAFLARRKGSLWVVALSGLMIGVAVGVREQNIVFAACLGMGVLLWSPRKLWMSTAFAVGVAVPLFFAASLNYAKHDVWHPFPKARTYSARASQQLQGEGVARANPLTVFWAKVVDYTTHPQVQDPAKALMFRTDKRSGALLVGSTMKKAWLQSAPWLLLGFVAIGGAWFSRKWRSDAERREVRILSLIILPILAMFTIAGFGWIDGWAYNQRYFLELVPLMALSAGLLLADESLKARDIVGGAIAGVLGAVGGLAIGTLSGWYSTVALAPLVVAGALLVCWFLRGFWKWGRIFAVLLGLAVGWSLALHFIDDVRASREKRRLNYARQEVLEESIPDHSALFAYWGARDAAGPLMLGRDIVLLDAWADGGTDAPTLARELMAQERAVYVLANGFPDDILENLRGSDSLVVVRDSPLRLLRLTLPPEESVRGE